MRDWFVKYALAAAPLAGAVKQEAGALAGAARRAVGHPPPIPPSRPKLQLVPPGARPAAPPALPTTQARAAEHAAMPLGLQKGPGGQAVPTPTARQQVAPPTAEPGVSSSRAGDLYGQKGVANARGDTSFNAADPNATHVMQGYDPAKISPEFKSRLERQKMMQEARGGVQPQRAITPERDLGGGMYSHGDEGVLSSSSQMFKAAMLWLQQQGITKLSAMSFLDELSRMAAAA